jgi:hypothetical protein
MNGLGDYGNNGRFFLWQLAFDGTLMHALGDTWQSAVTRTGRKIKKSNDGKLAQVRPLCESVHVLCKQPYGTKVP